MKVLFIAFSVMIGSTITVSTQAEHHDIPIISNNSEINNTFTIVNFINFTSLLMDIDEDKDLEGVELYDDGVALMDDYIEEGESSLDDDGHRVTVTSKEASEEEEDEDTDFNFLATRGRWSYAPGFIERMCRGECQKTGKPFGRLLGTRCQCYCPLNAPTLGLCVTSGSCDKYCSSIGYAKGGDCVYNNVCFCYCRKSDPYDVSQVYVQ